MLVSSSQRGVTTIGVLGVGLLLLSSQALALPRYGPIEISGNVSAQQLFRHKDIDNWAFIQQRNTFKLRFDYDMLDRGKLFNRFEVPFIQQAKLLLFYRGVYDSVYDYTPGFKQKDIWGNVAALPDDEGNLVPVKLGSFNWGANTKFENRLREAYIDLKLRDLPLSFRLGRQQIVWGETDNFRMLDRVNALDLTWHLQQESWDEQRIPYWMIKGLWDVGRVGPLSDAFVEFYWNPGDWYPAKKTFLPQPWSAPVTNPIVQISKDFKGIGDLWNGTKLFRQGDYSRTPGENSQVGLRFSSMTPQGVQFTLNYFWQRWAGGDDGTNAASIQGVLDATNQEIKARGQLPIEAIAPHVHAVGLSLNYAEEEYTQTVYRAETIYEFGVPFVDASKQFPDTGPNSNLYGILGQDVFGVSKRDMWKGMIAFDRPTWIRPLNRKTTFLILGQFFWHYLISNPQVACNDPDDSLPCPLSGQGKGFRGNFSSSGYASDGKRFIDNVRDWEILVTLAATTFYSGGKIVPFWIYVLDPVNSFNMELIWMCDYFITNNFILNLQQRYFVNTTREPVFETWGVGGTNRGRSETTLRLTYQF